MLKSHLYFLYMNKTAYSLRNQQPYQYPVILRLPTQSQNQYQHHELLWLIFYSKSQHLFLHIFFLLLIFFQYFHNLLKLFLSYHIYPKVVEPFLDQYLLSLGYCQRYHLLKLYNPQLDLDTHQAFHKLVPSRILSIYLVMV